jgi:hypothetical protein
MMRWLRDNAQWVVAIVCAAATLGAFAARAIAGSEVGPVAARVTSLEAHREDDARQLDRIEHKVDRLLEHK